MGYDCSSLGVYPFTPVNIGLIRGNAEEILGMKEMDAEVQILPGNFCLCRRRYRIRSVCM